MSARRTFTATARPGPRGGLRIPVPFDPSAVWGPKSRHYVRGTVNGMTIRARIEGDPVLSLGPAWCRDGCVSPGDRVTVVLEPEGPQQDTLADDVAAALGAEPEARAFFDSLATFYRKGYVNWIESAKRPETRARRIEQMMDALRARRKQR